MIIRDVQTNSREQMVDITHIVREELANSGLEDGLAVVFIPHTTAGVTINENADPDVQTDMIKGLKSFGLERENFRHLEGNSAAHIKASLIGSSVTVIVENGRPALGTWQGIYFFEFDGPRRRKVYLKFM